MCDVIYTFLTVWRQAKYYTVTYVNVITNYKYIQAVAERLKI